MFKKIGEVYTYRYEGADFKPFSKSDITDQVNDQIKIFNTWYPKSRMFYYDSIYQPNRNKILMNIQKNQ